MSGSIGLSRLHGSHAHSRLYHHQTCQIMYHTHTRDSQLRLFSFFLQPKRISITYHGAISLALLTQFLSFVCGFLGGAMFIISVSIDTASSSHVRIMWYRCGSIRMIAATPFSPRPMFDRRQHEDGCISHAYARLGDLQLRVPVDHLRRLYASLPGHRVWQRTEVSF